MVAFVGCVQPVLETSESIEMYFKSQLAMSPEGAFLYARTSAPGYLRAKFLKLLVDYCLETDPAVNALRLINLPFDDEEKPMFVEALKASPKENARDALLVWQMHQGRLEEALKGTRKAAAKGNKGGMDWGVLGDGLQKGLGGRGGVEA